MNLDILKTILLWGIITGLVFIFAGPYFLKPDVRNTAVTYSDFIEAAKTGVVKEVLINKKTGEILFKTTDGAINKTDSPETDNSALLGLLLEKHIIIDTVPIKEPSALEAIFISWFPMILLIAVWVFFIFKMQSGGMGSGLGGVPGFGKSKARLLSEDNIKTTFKDVAGCDEAKEEVYELVEFLKNPGKFLKLGAKIPRGVLMVGEVGVGKTLLARAIAGEAKVPFFSISGSDFVEMFVGVGASRVRDMFEQAKKQSPCIVFIDEIDAVGRHRGAGLGGGHDEREQTLNQLLVEMDGFEPNAGIIIVAATNRPDVLDPALIRPGRFDRQVIVNMPDVRGREQILGIHAAKVPTDGSLKLNVIAKGTPGFSGADLANLVNEAAIFAARANKEIVTMVEFELAKDKVMMGPERRSMVMDDKEKRMTAYHEAGHAIVGLSVPSQDPAYKVTIIPRGRALGVTMFLPESDRLSNSRQKLESMLSTAFGGRVAEELIFGSEYVTTGASNDIEKATSIARNMITKWGFSEKLGPIVYEESQGEINMSEQTAREIEDEIRILVNRNYKRATTILTEKMNILHNMAAALLEHETIDDEQLKRLMAGGVIEAKPVVVASAMDIRKLSQAAINVI